MEINNKVYARDEVLQRVGNMSQLGGTRHYILNEGRCRGVSAIEVNTGAGLVFTLLPDRGLDISAASYRGLNLVYHTPNGEVHPAFYEPQGQGWLRTFFGGLLTTCGLTYLGPPGRDGEEELGLHGRYTNTPASRVQDRSDWSKDEYRIEVSGVVEECALFGDKVRLTRTITTHLGSKSLELRDVAENFGYSAAPFTILYHINAGFPLLDATSELVLTAGGSLPYDRLSSRRMDSMLAFSTPVPGFQEENFLHTMRSDEEGFAYAAMINRELAGGVGLCLRFDSSTLPYLNEWKMMGQGDYVVGIEPSNVQCLNRVELRDKGALPMLAPGETRQMRLEIGVLAGQEEIEAFVRKAEEIVGMVEV